jgi:hypothetical protein
MALSKVQRNFLTSYELHGSITAAADEAGSQRTLHYRWLDNPEYKAAFEQAEENACQAVDREIRRRAVEGIEEPVVYQGRISYERVRVGKKYVKKPVTINRKSDILLMFYAKSKRPNVYRDNAKVELELSVPLIEALKEGRKRLLEENERSSSDNITGS